MATDTITIIALINPAVCAILATALLVFWNNQRQRSYIAVLSAAFAFLAAGFALQFLAVQSGGPALRLLANSLLMFGTATLVLGVLGRVERKPPLVRILAIVGATLAVYLWYLLIEPLTVARVVTINFGGGFLVLLLVAELAKTGSRKPVDRFLFWFFAAWGVQFFLRTVLAVLYEADEIADANFFATLYWATLTFSIAFFLLIFAVVIVAAIAVDLQEELRTESFTDPLSGLLNRRGFNKRLEEALNDARAKAMPLALVVADLDRFKEVNDRFGHAVGDSAIVSFSNCLRQVMGGEHVAGRMGGEEFAILLRGADIRMARLFAEGLRTNFAGLVIPGLPVGHTLTASFGVAVLQPGEDWEDLLKRADRALYRAKEEGRDRVVVCTHTDDGAVAADNKTGRRPLMRDGSSAAAQPGD
ncbi:diguanylate cyclase [Chelativorans sp. ZYF759]|uniref:GGDEF domain-containing protein n=1 Tax=Chelativorans sp. ZYF759 TaxID=2692213 RepID=UPI00145D8AE9|nr:GGDEF domain-containing protein [Chelativorans sp. ZYF759]NMG38094.1 diguanylate cyclase [Chelativorans sp. ZYF759]